MPQLPKVRLIQAPTPLHRLDFASDDLGIDLWIKRDDLTGFALGGNKGRKLEYLIGAALAEGATAIVTCGSIQSNFIRQLGAACAMFGLKCAAAVMATPYEFAPPSNGGLRDEGGNALLDAWLGVEMHVYANGTWEELFKHLDELSEGLKKAGSKVFRVPVGGSMPEGAYGFWVAGRELYEQAPPGFDSVVFASSSGSTQVGLAHWFRSSETDVIGIACDPEPEIAQEFVELSKGFAPLIGEHPLVAEEFRIKFDFVGPGYGIPSGDGNQAIRYLARREGIFLDPIYSGKAFAALMAGAKSGELSGRVCFWHTGGTPALFAM
jgi:D-cysteine desulfhydrase/L-cysteate sulfo-lyase